MTTSPTFELDEHMFFSLRHHGVLECVKQHQLCEKEKRILVACRNLGKAVEVLGYHLREQGIQLNDPLVDPVLPTAGSLVLCEDYPLAKEFPWLSRYWCKEIKYTMDNGGHRIILLHAHRPCARERDFGHDLFETTRRLFQAKDTLRSFLNEAYAENPVVLAEIKIIPLFDMLRTEGIRTYFANRAEWKKFTEAGQCELVAGASSHL